MVYKRSQGSSLRLELVKAGLDLVESLVAWEAASRYGTVMHNLHGKIQNTGKIGKELLRNTSEGTRISAMFCSRVLAGTPDIGRFVTAASLYSVRNSFAHFVCAKIAVELKFFQAKSLKLVFPIEYRQYHSLHSRFPILLPNPLASNNDTCPHSSHRRGSSRI